MDHYDNKKSNFLPFQPKNQHCIHLWPFKRPCGLKMRWDRTDSKNVKKIVVQLILMKRDQFSSLSLQKRTPAHICGSKNQHMIKFWFFKGTENDILRSKRVNTFVGQQTAIWHFSYKIYPFAHFLAQKQHLGPPKGPVGPKRHTMRSKRVPFIVG